MHRQGSEGGTKWRPGGRDERGVEAERGRQGERERQGGREAGLEGEMEVGRQASRQKGREGGRSLGRGKCNIGLAELLISFQSIESEKIKEIAEKHSIREFLSMSIYFSFHLRGSRCLPSFLPLERREILLLSCMK